MAAARVLADNAIATSASTRAAAMVHVTMIGLRALHSTHASTQLNQCPAQMRQSAWPQYHLHRAQPSDAGQLWHCCHVSRLCCIVCYNTSSSCRSI